MLTKEEMAWVKKMQKLLDQAPPRFGFYTTGDPVLNIYDKGKEALFDEDRDMPLEINKHDAALGHMRFTLNVHGVCG
jgi:hypothetical protein